MNNNSLSLVKANLNKNKKRNQKRNEVKKVSNLLVLKEIFNKFKVKAQARQAKSKLLQKKKMTSLKL